MPLLGEETETQREEAGCPASHSPSRWQILNYTDLPRVGPMHAPETVGFWWGAACQQWLGPREGMV